MGHGVSSGLSGGGAGATKIPLPSGGYIDLTGSPLIYGGNDPNVDKKSRKEVTAFERAHRDERKREYGILIDKDGKVIAEEVGTNGHLVWKNTPYSTFVKANIMLHNHNRQDLGILGATFSVRDIQNHVLYNRPIDGAIAKEGTYFISNRQNFNGSALVDAYSSFHRKSSIRRTKDFDRLEARWNAGEITKVEYYAGQDRLNNEHFIRLHNFLLDNQSRYGYNYTLERRKK